MNPTKFQGFCKSTDILLEKLQFVIILYVCIILKAPLPILFLYPGEK